MNHHFFPERGQYFNGYFAILYSIAHRYFVLSHKMYNCPETNFHIPPGRKRCDSPVIIISTQFIPILYPIRKYWFNGSKRKRNSPLVAPNPDLCILVQWIIGHLFPSILIPVIFNLGTNSLCTSFPGQKQWNRHTEQATLFHSALWWSADQHSPLSIHHFDKTISTLIFTPLPNCKAIVKYMSKYYHLAMPADRWPQVNEMKDRCSHENFFQFAYAPGHTLVFPVKGALSRSYCPHLQ